MVPWNLKQQKQPVLESKPLIPQDMTLEQIRPAMLRLMGEESLNHHQMGQYYNYVVEKDLAQAAGYKNAPEYFSQNLRDVSPATLAMYGTVARNFSEEITARFGVTCLSLLLTYREMAGITVDREQPDLVPIEVPDAKGVVTTKTFGECSTNEMRRALQRKRKPTSSRPLPQEAWAVTEQVTTAVALRFEKTELIRVKLRNHQGEAVLDITGIPLSKLAKLAQALMDEPTASEAQPDDKLPELECGHIKPGVACSEVHQRGTAVRASRSQFLGSTVSSLLLGWNCWRAPIRTKASIRNSPIRSSPIARARMRPVLGSPLWAREERRIVPWGREHVSEVTEFSCAAIASVVTPSSIRRRGRRLIGFLIVYTPDDAAISADGVLGAPVQRCGATFTRKVIGGDTNKDDISFSKHTVEKVAWFGKAIDSARAWGDEILGGHHDGLNCLSIKE